MTVSLTITTLREHLSNIFFKKKNNIELFAIVSKKKKVKNVKDKSDEQLLMDFVWSFAN